MFNEISLHQNFVLFEKIHFLENTKLSFEGEKSLFNMIKRTCVLHHSIDWTFVMLEHFSLHLPDDFIGFKWWFCTDVWAGVLISLTAMLTANMSGDARHSRAFRIIIPKKCFIKVFAQNIIYRPCRRYSKSLPKIFFHMHSKFSPNEHFSHWKFQNCRRELANSSFDWKFRTEKL